MMDREFIQLERSQGSWHYLFQKLHQIARANAGTQLLAKKPMNVIRNRYRDVLPIDDTRVKLNDPDNDYINANHVKVDEVNRKYILCQGPLQHTCPHFWQMIWDQKSAAIVMLNKCVERGMNKCYPYWPTAEEPPIDMGKFRVENLGTELESSYQLSHLKLEHTETNESRVVLHYHYTQWPDFGVPQNPDVFLEFLYAVRGSGSLGSDVGPAVVHCSAGIGRSGTFCLVDVILAKLEQTKDLASVDLQNILLDMRRQRLGLIQTPDQLRFSYIAILQGAIQDLQIEPSNYDDLIESEEEEEEEEEEESDSDEVADDEEHKYPNLTRQYGTSPSTDPISSDVPPPLPPRPIDTLSRSLENSADEESEEEFEIPRKGGTPPPPPSSLPPGPPIVYSPEHEEDHEQLPKKMKMDDNGPTTDLFADLQNGDEYGFKITTNDAYRNSIENDDEVEVLEESGSEEEEMPPPIPPRNHSLSPSPNQTPYHDVLVGGRVDIYGENSQLESKSNGGSFLVEGRGGDKVSPPLPKMMMNHVGNINVEAENGSESSTPPPLPTKLRRRQPPSKSLHDIEEEEKALISELNELEKLVTRSTAVPSKEEEVPVIDKTVDESRTSSELIANSIAKIPEELESQNKLSAVELRKLERDARRARIHSKVQNIKEQLKQSEEDNESEWSIPWLLVGFIVMLGYCAYYIIH